MRRIADGARDAHIESGRLQQRIWAWLPARATRSRVTIPTVIAAALDADQRDVSRALAAMERAGHAIRDRATGTRSGWHRGTPIPTDEATSCP